MSNLVEEIKTLKSVNNELVQKVQFWKMKSGQSENEKLELMKEINELRMQLARARSGAARAARALDAALQAASEEVLAHLVAASAAAARGVELTKAYTRERLQAELRPPRWSSLGATPAKDKVNKVPPMTMGGRSIQPFVSLSRVTVNNSSSASTPRSPNQNRSERVLPLPMHMLQDVYIPLRRLDPADYGGGDAGPGAPAAPADPANPADPAVPAARPLDEDDNPGDLEESYRETDEYEMRQLDVLLEDPEDEPSRISRARSSEAIEGARHDTDAIEGARHSAASPRGPRLYVTPPPGPRRSVNPPSGPRGGGTPPRAPDPMEGPSWLLNSPQPCKRARGRAEPDSTTQPEERSPVIPVTSAAGGERREFTPTVRRRKRTSPPPDADRSRSRSSSARELKVVVPRMRLSATPPPPAGTPAPPAGTPATPAGTPATPAGTPATPAGTPAKPAARAPPPPAPSPHGSTDAALIVLEQSGASSYDTSRDSDSGGEVGGGGGGRSRRARRPVVYKEKPLNRKLRR